MSSKIDVEKLMNLVLKAAESARMDAGYGGRHDDGGASHMEAQVRFYRLGQRNEIPDEWKTFANQLDPEYETFLRLKEKFRDK